jgi:hypothetical protein
VSVVSRDDPWSGAGDHTRAEVREIFARHAQARAASDAGPEEWQRRRALPNVLLLPGRGWRALSPAGKAVAVLIAAALLALAAVKLPPAIQNALENEANERAAIAANRERIRRELLESQAPRRAVLEPGKALAQALAAAVAADARGRVAAGDLDGPLGPTACRAVRRAGERDATVFTCLVEQHERAPFGEREIVQGYRFRGRVVHASRRAAWCKENPRPLHGDQEEFVVVKLSRACTG